MPQSDKANPGTAPKLVDVIAPGKTPPSPSGKPIIVSNRPMIKDPMMPAQPKPAGAALQPMSHGGTSLSPTLHSPDNQDQAADPEKVSAKRTMKTIAAPVSPVEGDKDDEDSRPAKTATSDPAKPASISSDTPPKPDSSATAPAADSQPTDSSGSPDVPLADNAKERAEKERELRAAELEKIIASKQYYLPITDAEKRRGDNRALIWLILSVFGALVWLDLALDAGLVRLGGIHALTHFFGK